MEEYKEWLQKAEEDLDTALYNIKGKKFEAGLFFLQQSAEKALKSLYIKKFKELFKTHDLVILANRLNAPEGIIECCRKLSPIYFYTRYPSKEEVKNLENKVEDYVRCSKEIIKWIKEHL